MVGEKNGGDCKKKDCWVGAVRGRARSARWWRVLGKGRLERGRIGRGSGKGGRGSGKWREKTKAVKTAFVGCGRGRGVAWGRIGRGVTSQTSHDRFANR